MKTKTSVKKAMREMLNNLPDNMTWEDLQYHIYVRQKIEKGLEAIRKGDVIPHSKVVRQLKKWITA